MCRPKTFKYNYGADHRRTCIPVQTGPGAGAVPAKLIFESCRKQGRGKPFSAVKQKHMFHTSDLIWDLTYE